MLMTKCSDDGDIEREGGREGQGQAPPLLLPGERREERAGEMRGVR